MTLRPLPSPNHQIHRLITQNGEEAEFPLSLVMSLSEEEFNRLRELTLEARQHAYCPYSKFQVGATILTDTGDYIQGANVENASYGGAICAERTAAVKAVTSGHKKFKAVGVASSENRPCSPCGICRQFLCEFGTDVLIYMFSSDGEFVKMTLNELLPMSFGPKDLSDDITLW